MFGRQQTLTAVSTPKQLGAEMGAATPPTAPTVQAPWLSVHIRTAPVRVAAQKAVLDRASVNPPAVPHWKSVAVAQLAVGGYGTGWLAHTVAASFQAMQTTGSPRR